jgi:hypothetical protein
MSDVMVLCKKRQEHEVKRQGKCASSFWSTVLVPTSLAPSNNKKEKKKKKKRLIEFNLRLLSLGAGAFFKLGDSARDKLYGGIVREERTGKN